MNPRWRNSKPPRKCRRRACEFQKSTRLFSKTHRETVAESHVSVTIRLASLGNLAEGKPMVQEHQKVLYHSPRTSILRPLIICKILINKTLIFLIVLAVPSPNIRHGALGGDLAGSTGCRLRIKREQQSRRLGRQTYPYRI